MDSIRFDDLVSLKRYFYLVALSGDGGYDSKQLCKDVGIKIKQSTIGSFAGNQFSIDRAECKSDIVFYGGSSDFSVNGDGNPPYSYDIFIISLESPKILLVAFPFKLLAKQLISILLDTKQLLKKSKFIRCDVDRVLRSSDENDMSLHNFSCFFSGLDLQLKGETSISSVNLDGDRPLLSPLYKTVFRELLLDNKCRLESCHLKGVLEGSDIQPRTRLSIFIDMFGNYRLYIYRSGNNLFSLPALFTFLHSKNSLIESSTNPLFRIDDERL